ncbi:MAG TPA: histidinol dehydrogenase, partial [Spirochaetota bacterium]|nr:histidinol dehydrogenase [Spirochaetota bacterium]
MIPVKRLSDLTKAEKTGLFFRFGDDFSKIMTDTVIPIVNDVKNLGNSAVINYTEKFDKFKIDSVLAENEEIEKGYSNTSKEVIIALEKAVDNIREFHSKQIKNDFSYSRTDGSLLGVK